MPQQAILDLPVIEFEDHRASLAALQDFCISNYGLIGLRPHDDAVFHFTASLWRFRAEESLFQVAALSAGYLYALTGFVAARRRLSAARQSKLDTGVDSANLDSLDVEKAEIHLDQTSDTLEDAGVILSSFFRPEISRSRQDRNIDLMREPEWVDRLESFCGAVVKYGPIIKRWRGDLVDILDELARYKADVLAASSNGNTGLLQRLKKEVTDYQGLASQASVRLSEVNRERKELENLLSNRETSNVDQSLALEEARHALDVTLADARERLTNLEASKTKDASLLQQQIDGLEAENAKLADELMLSETRATSGAVDAEDLIEKLENANDERENAAITIENLSTRLKVVQEELEVSRDDEQVRAEKLESSVDDLRTDLVRSEADLHESKATIDALESEKARQSEYDDLLTASEARLLEAEDELENSSLRVEQLKNISDAKQEEISDLETKLETSDTTISEVSSQLAESETLIQGHSAHIEDLESENERLRRDLSDAQGQMLNAKGDYEESVNKERDARAQVTRMQEQQKDEHEEISLLKEELETVRLEIQTLSDMAEEASKHNEDLKDALEKIRLEYEEVQNKLKEEAEKLEKATSETESIQSQLSEKEERLSEASSKLEEQTSNSEELTSETANLKYEIEKLQNDLEEAADKESTTRRSLIELKTGAVELEQDLVSAQENESASREAAQDRELKLREKLELLEDRVKNADKEKQTFLDALQTGENNRRDEKTELEAVIEKLRKESESRHATMLEAQQQADSFKSKLDESDSFVIERERELEKTNNRKKFFEQEIQTIADLRSQYENANKDDKRDVIASQISRRLDGLFSEVGRPVHADRRTEKILVLHVKKSDEEIAAEAAKDFVATNADTDSSDSNDEQPSENESFEAQSPKE
ncbi:MAG: hypothetical protein L3J82_06390 [Planctomycetes bacterium]|nr:hypothetical protein [Planctomycetota bacterium]